MEEYDIKGHRHFESNMERSIQLANREIINPLVAPFTEERIIAVAVEVAKLRGAYLKAALDIGLPEKPGTTPFELKALRESYEEAREAFAALMTSIERGYVDLPSQETKPKQAHAG
jgi:hypothetical protein